MLVAAIFSIFFQYCHPKCTYLSVLGLWSSQSNKGSRPPPCSSFSLTVTDEDQAVMFGGNTPSDRSSEARVLHLPTMVSHSACLE